jgi:hypothetical protein
VLLAANLLPREVVEVSNARAAGHESPLMGARSRRGYRSIGDVQSGLINNS